MPRERLFSKEENIDYYGSLIGLTIQSLNIDIQGVLIMQGRENETAQYKLAELMAIRANQKNQRRESIIDK